MLLHHFLNFSFGKNSWENNIKMDLREIGWEGVYWMHLAQDQWQALVNTVMHLWVLLKGGNFLTS
jgi:hypothetical protein